jgi:hypothetical protein
LNTINDILTYLSLAILLLNIILYLKGYRPHRRAVAFKIFIIYILCMFAVLVTSNVFAMYTWNNLFLSHLYFISQFILLSLFYGRLFTRAQQLVTHIVGIIVLIIIGMHYVMDPSQWHTFSLLEVFLTSFPLVIYSIIHLYNSLNKKGAYLYINAGILVYLSSSTLIFFLGNYQIGLDESTVSNMWFMNKVLYLIYLILIFFEWKYNISQSKRRLP